jgi:hypothetical protein
MFSGGSELDYDQLGRELIASLNLDDTAGKKRTMYGDADAIFRHPTNGARVFIGDLRCAESRERLAAHGITAIVNCQGPESENFFEKDPAFIYLRFPSAMWWKFIPSHARTDKNVLTFFAPCFRFIDEAVASGRSVLIHCLAGNPHPYTHPNSHPVTLTHPNLHSHPNLTLTAGAHRAGTTGVAYVMHATGLELKTALPLTQRCRSVVNPIGTLTELLQLLDRALAPSRGGKTPLPFPAAGAAGAAGAAAAAAAATADGAAPPR